MSTRRKFLAAAPAFIGSALAARYSITEIERLIAKGDVKGKLMRDDLPTPALLLDLDKFEANVNKMTSFAKSKGKAFRPHGKTHKCPEIARRLVAAGAVGACAAKISEAEVFADGGVAGLLVTSAPVGRLRVERAIRLAKRRPDTIFCVDNASNVEELNQAAAAAKIKLNLAVDLLVGRRTGIVPGEPAVALAKQIAAASNLKLQGLQAYSGHASHVKGFADRKRVSEEEMGKAVETRRMLEKAGIPCNWLSGASTGTYNIDADIDGVTELQPGSFMFMDVDYAQLNGKDGSERYRDFEHSLTVLSSVISMPSDKSPIVDAGLKAFATDRPYVPEAKGVNGISYKWAGDEHGSLTLGDGAPAVKNGDRMEFLVTHCDPTVNLYDRMFGLRGDQVEAVWTISARGKSQ